jgi:hypothetical protein
MPEEGTLVGLDAVSGAADSKEEQANVLAAAAAVIGGAASVAIALNRGSTAALGAGAACGVIAAYLVNNGRAVQASAEALRATGASFGAANDDHTAAVGGLVDAPGTGIATTWA